MLAICLAVFPAGMSRAEAPRVVSHHGTTEPHVHVHLGEAALHEHGSAVSDVAHATVSSADLDASAVGFDGDEASFGTSDEGGGNGCGSTCCGFACHAYQLVAGLMVAGPMGRPTQRLSEQDEQVGSGMPSFIERPPRSL